GGILVTPTVGGAASMGNGALTSSGGELIIHNHADPLGSLAISAGITGNVDLTFSGTGRTVLSGTNTFNGTTRINGGTVQIDDASRLGSTVSNLELRGGTLFTTASMTITNRTIILGGEGGTFQVAAGTTNFIANVLSESNYLNSTRLNNGLGDLVKTGAGTLSLGSTNSTANNLTAGYNMIQGLTDVREGTLRVVANNNYALGSSKSFYDGTIVRSGATLTLASNNFSYAIQEWLMFEQGSALRVEPTIGGYNAMSANGVMDFRGDTRVEVVSGDFYFNNSGAGYIMGAGDIIKDGGGALDIDEYSPDYTGDLIVKQGILRLQGVDNNPLPNAGSVTIGLNDTTNRGSAIFVAWTDRDGSASEWNIDQNITVQGYTGDTRLEMYAPNHNDVVNFNGNIDLSNFGSNGWAGSEFRFTIEDQVESLTIPGADEYREEEYMNLNGDITGGNKRIRTYVRQNYYSSGGYNQRMEPVPGAQITNEMNIMAFFTFSGTNTGWTGSLEVGNRAGTDVVAAGPDQDKQHFVRFGNNDGAATLAIGPSNSVVLRHDATLQAYGSQVTIGNLFSDGNSGGTDGYFGQELVTNSFLENGGTVAGSFTINQTSNRTFNAIIRDGTYYSPTSTNLASAALSIIKAGSGALTFDRSNYYTGTTTVREGLLQVNGSHLGGGLYSVLAGGSLGGTGIIGSAVSVADGGTLAPGDLNAGAGGTLNINSGLVLSNNAILSFDLDGTDGTAGGGINDLVQGIGNLVLDGMLTISPLVSFSGAGTNDFWTLMTYSGSLTDNGLVVDGTSQLLLDPGLAFYVYSFEGGAIDQIRLGIMVPEPSTWALLATGLGMVAWMARRRRR
ncbi:MAG TPA: autotransporter-associated beta strand repeat-containing protein, partial [Verrucomicrobiae bacterium]|nr:autotransporter-associated beta strand repeat-containing protein [Verrucomicrobiae bacterium]